MCVSEQRWNYVHAFGRCQGNECARHGAAAISAFGAMPAAGSAFGATPKAISAVGAMPAAVSAFGATP